MNFWDYFFIRSIRWTLCELWTAKTERILKFCFLFLARQSILALFWVRQWNNWLPDLIVRHWCIYSSSFCNFGTLINRKYISSWLLLLFVYSINRSSIYGWNLLYWPAWRTNVSLSIVMIVRGFFKRFEEWVSIESMTRIIAHSFSKLLIRRWLFIF
jgi:hypothetical protein